MACPICGEKTAPGYRPFCSRRCADLDLARWLRGDYRIETEEGPDGDLHPASEDGPGGR